MNRHKVPLVYTAICGTAGIGLMAGGVILAVMFAILALFVLLIVGLR